MFVGTYLHTVDAKGRVVLPSSFRDRFTVVEDDAVTRRCVVTKGRDGQLVVYPMSVWRREAEEISSLPPTPRNRRKQRAFFGQASEQILDKQGRLRLNPELREFASIDAPSDVYMVGVYHHIELWNKDVYEREQERQDQELVEADDDEEEREIDE